MKTGPCTRGVLLVIDSVCLVLGAIQRGGLLYKAWFVMQDDVIHTMVGRETKPDVSREGSKLFQFCTQ